MAEVWARESPTLLGTSLFGDVVPRGRSPNQPLPGFWIFPSKGSDFHVIAVDGPPGPAEHWMLFAKLGTLVNVCGEKPSFSSASPRTPCHLKGQNPTNLAKSQARPFTFPRWQVHTPFKCLSFRPAQRVSLKGNHHLNLGHFGGCLGPRFGLTIFGNSHQR